MNTLNPASSQGAEKKKRSVFLRLLEASRPYRKRFFLAVGCMFIASACNVVPPWLLKNVVDDVLIAKDLAMLNTLPFLLVALFAGKGIASYGHQYLMNWVGQNVVMDLRLRLYDHLQRMSLRYLYGKRLGELMSRITNDVTILQNLVTSVIVNLVVQTATFLGMVGFLLYINWKLTLITFAVLPLTVVILDRAAKKLRAVGHTIQSELAGLSAVVHEAFAAVRIVRSFATEDLELARFRKSNRENFRAVMHGVQVQAALAGIIEVVLIAALAVILWLGRGSGAGVNSPWRTHRIPRLLSDFSSSPYGCSHPWSAPCSLVLQPLTGFSPSSTYRRRRPRLQTRSPWECWKAA